MLEAITDFWKPNKKSQQPAKLKLAELQIGSVIGFGYVPQAALSGRRFKVAAINSYQFGKDVLTSFVLSNEKDAEISMIIAEAQGEQYLAISRRLSANDRNKLFDSAAINEIISKNENTKFTCRDNVPELKGWLVSNYKREIQGMSGNIYKYDFRKERNEALTGEEFQYTLLGSNSNEHAIEIEDYGNGRVDIYATIYRRTSDIAEMIYLPKDQPIEQKSDLKLVSKDEKSQQPVKEQVAEPVVVAKEVEKSAPVVETAKTPEVKEQPKEEAVKIEEKKVEPVKLEDVDLPQMVATPLVEKLNKDEIEKEIKEELQKNETTKNNNEENKDMSLTAVSTNEVKPNLTNGAVPSFGSTPSKDLKQEIAVNKNANNGMDNEAIECELRVANQIIEEAIRNEMRLSDVVRRIIELPVAHQESVHIPLNLADEDFSLLAIRYGIPASDRNAIKSRIIQELGDFSGSKKKAA